MTFHPTQCKGCGAWLSARGWCTRCRGPRQAALPFGGTHAEPDRRGRRFQGRDRAVPALRRGPAPDQADAEGVPVRTEQADTGALGGRVRHLPVARLATRLRRVTGHPWRSDRGHARLEPGLVARRRGAGRSVEIVAELELAGEVLRWVVYRGVPETAPPRIARMARRIPRAYRAAFFDALDLGDWIQAWRRRVARRRRLAAVLRTRARQEDRP